MSVAGELSALPGIEVRPGEATSFRVHGLVPAAEVAPESAEAAAEVLRLATRHGWRVELAGRGASLDAGRSPRDGRVDLLLTTRRLDAITDYVPADLTATVGAGVTLGGLAARLAPDRQLLPLDPPGAETATLGAVVARGDAGPLRLAYGTPRDHVLGLELVTGDGRILQLGGRVMKNVAGYDLVRLAIGSHGTLGLITRIIVRLRPHPAADRTLALGSRSEDACVDVARRIRAARLEPAALEILSPEASARVPAVDGWTLLARLHGPSGAVEDLASRARALAGENGLDAEALEPGAAEAVWRSLSKLEAGAAVLVRLADRPAELPRTLALAGEVAGAGGPGWTRIAHAGDGIVRVLGPAEGMDERARDGIVAAVERSRLKLRAGGGTAIVTRMPAALSGRLDPYGPVQEVGVMERIRKTFDPGGILAPGRFVL